MPLNAGMRHGTNGRGLRRLLATGFMLMLLALAGCESARLAPSSSLAAVLIPDAKPLAVARAISAVFTEAGFKPVTLPPGPGMHLVFEKPGSAADALLYGGLSSSKVWYRAKLSIEQPGPDGCLVTCDAYRVTDKGDPRFEEENKLSSLSRGGYGKLLKQVRERVERGGGEAPPGSP